MKLDRTTIEPFLRQAVAAGLTQGEIAAQLQVGQSTVAYWYRKYHMAPADKFPRHFRCKYGADAIERFRGLVQQERSLREIGAAFGFSTEYARQVFHKLYGHYRPYTKERRRDAAKQYYARAHASLSR